MKEYDFYIIPTPIGNLGDITLRAIKTTYGSDIKIFEQTIPRTESLAETASEGVSIFAYDEKSKGADSYLELVQEVLKHA